MAKQSAGILLYRLKDKSLEVLLVHPGGPFWKKKDAGAWSIPKGEFEAEDALQAAKREFEEEIGIPLEGRFVALETQKQKGGKIVHAWAVEGDLDTQEIQSNTFEMEWPPKSGQKQEFPEIDRAEWFSVSAALEKLNRGQAAFIQELAEKLDLQG